MIGINYLKNFIITAPLKPGIYRMLNQNGNVLYIGKAKNLKNRLTSYTQLNSITKRITIMIHQIRKIELIVTDTEKEALILEATLIRNLKPKYNILLKDDKSFPYIVIRQDHDFGQILKTRNKDHIKGSYFGPYASITHVNKAIESLQKIFLLRPCSDSYFNNRKRPCLQYEIKRCSAPCVNKINKNDYKKNITQAKRFLEGHANHLQNQLVTQMEEASSKLLYEKAADIRDRIVALNNIRSTNSTISNIKNSDFIALEKSGDIICVQIFFFRNGQNYGNKSYFIDDILGAKQQEIMKDFLLQFYQNIEKPKQIYLNIIPDDKDIIEKILNTKIFSPKIGNKMNVMEFVLKNCHTTLNTKLLNKSKQKQFIQSLANELHINQEINRIDVFDNSHLFGKHAIGAMIVANNEGFAKKLYRVFNITKTTKGDDYAMLREVLTRKYNRLISEYPNYTKDQWPDLIIIDGGLGHYNIAQEILTNLELKIPLLCIAKGEIRNAGHETLHYKNKEIKLSNNNVAMQYLQRLRDEAHRFAITKHRLKRKNDNFKSSLNEIQSIGDQRKKILLNHFGSLQAIENASIKELMEVKNINLKLAKEIYNFFHIH